MSATIFNRQPVVGLNTLINKGQNRTFTELIVAIKTRMTKSESREKIKQNKLNLEMAFKKERESKRNSQNIFM